MIGLVCFVLTVLASPFKSKLRLDRAWSHVDLAQSIQPLPRHTSTTAMHC